MGERTERAFLAGPSDANFEWCDGFARLHGYKPIHSNIAEPNLREYFSEEETQKLLLDIISLSGAIIMVDGWQDDKQCNMWLSVAKSQNKRVYYQAYYGRKAKE